MAVIREEREGEKGKKKKGVTGNCLSVPGGEGKKRGAPGCEASPLRQNVQRRGEGEGKKKFAEDLASNSFPFREGREGKKTRSSVLPVCKEGCRQVEGEGGEK